MRLSAHAPTATGTYVFRNPTFILRDARQSHDRLSLSFVAQRAGNAIPVTAKERVVRTQKPRNQIREASSPSPQALSQRVP